MEKEVSNESISRSFHILFISSTFLAKKVAGDMVKILAYNKHANLPSDINKIIIKPIRKWKMPLHSNVMSK